MLGRAFVDLAQEVIAGDSEIHRRCAVGRAYYGLMLECRDALFRWGFMLPPRDNVHSFVRLRFTFAANADLKDIGMTLEELVKLRNVADYQLTVQANFRSNATAEQAIDDAAEALAMLDAIDSDTGRQVAAIAAVRKAFPYDPVHCELIVSLRITLSSRDIRRRIAEGRSVRYMIPRAAEAYIADKGLYRNE